MIDQYVNLRASDLAEDKLNARSTIGGVIMDIRKVTTKKSNAEMAFIKVFDGTGDFDCVVFPKLYAECKDILNKETVVLIDGKLDHREDAFSVIIDDIRSFNPDYDVRINQTAVEIEIPQNADSNLLQKVNSTLRQYPGASPVSILIASGDKWKKMNLAFTVAPDTAMVQNIEEILGNNTIRLI
jgi:DNA polymerase-3 subunit alpha